MNEENDNGESALFFAIKNKRWNFLKELQAVPFIGNQLCIL
jgi:hypothetical protein